MILTPCKLYARLDVVYEIKCTWTCSLPGITTINTEGDYQPTTQLWQYQSVMTLNLFTQWQLSTWSLGDDSRPDHSVMNLDLITRWWLSTWSLGDNSRPHHSMMTLDLITQWWLNFITRWRLSTWSLSDDSRLDHSRLQSWLSSWSLSDDSRPDHSVTTLDLITRWWLLTWLYGLHSDHLPNVCE